MSRLKLSHSWKIYFTLVLIIVAVFSLIITIYYGNTPGLDLMTEFVVFGLIFCISIVTLAIFGIVNLILWINRK